MGLTPIRKTIKQKRAEESKEVNERLLAMLEEQNKQLMGLVGKLLDQVSTTAEAQRTWVELFKPPTQPVQSTTPEQREQMGLNGKADAWNEFDAQQMLKEIGLYATADEEDGKEF